MGKRVEVRSCCCQKTAVSFWASVLKFRFYSNFWHVFMMNYVIPLFIHREFVRYFDPIFSEGVFWNVLGYFDVIHKWQKVISLLVGF
jgi:hypothetical protein